MAFQHLHLLYHIQLPQLNTLGLLCKTHLGSGHCSGGVCMPILVVLVQHTDKEARLRRSFLHGHQYLKTSGEHVSLPQRAGVGLSRSRFKLQCFPSVFYFCFLNLSVSVSPVLFLHHLGLTRKVFLFCFVFSKQACFSGAWLSFLFTARLG